MSTYCKYYKQQKQVSHDSGQTWADVVPKEYHLGSLYEIDSFDCAVGEPLIRWTKVLGDYLCDGKNKFEKEIEQYSIDNGITWENMYPPTYRKGNLIEANSDVCDNKWEGHYRVSGETECTGHGYIWVPGVGCVWVDPVKFIRCSSSTSTTLTQTDIIYNPYFLVWGIIGDCVTEIGNNAFSGCTSLSGLTLLDADSITSIGDKAFYNCNQLTSIEISSGITSIGASAFTNCTSISGITINATTPPSLGADAFIGTSFPIYVPCDSFNEYTSGSGWSTYANRIYGMPPCVEQRKLVVTYLDGTTMYRNCDSSVLTTGDTGYRSSASAITSAEIGDCVTSIGEDTFRQCYSLTSIDIPSGITTIGNYAFYDCSGLTSIDIPSGVTSIGASAFRYCTSLSGITVNATTPPTLDFNTAAFNNTNNCPIYVPCESVNIYKMTAEWNSYESRIQGIPPCETPPPAPLKLQASYTGGTSYEILCDSSTTLTQTEVRGYSAIYNSYTAMTDVIVGNCVDTIGGGAFGYCGSLSSVTIGNSVTSIGINAFTYCTSLTSITIPDSVTSISEQTFSDCANLSSCSIGSGVTSIGQSAFYGCSSLTSIDIPSGVTTIEYMAFRYCTSLASIETPDTVTSIGASAFTDCSNLTSATINSGTIGADAFGYCTSLTNCVIGSGVTSIGDGAFRGCSILSSCTIGNGVTTIGQAVFSNCSGFTSITIPDSVTSIGGWAFQSCVGLTSIDIPSGVTVIGQSAFSGCRSLTSVTVNSITPPTIGNSVLYNTNNCPIYVPCESVDTYKSASGWSGYSSRIFGIPPCVNVEYRWINLDPSTDYYCSGTTKYYKQQKQESYDSGQTWSNVVPAEYQQGGIAEEQSTDCGYIPTEFKFKATYSGGTSYIKECDSTTTLTTGDTNPSGYNYTAMTSGEIGDCVTSIGTYAFEDCSGMTSCTIGDDITTIGNGAFIRCSSLTSVNIPSGVTSIGQSAFYNCSSLTSIDIPNSVTSIGNWAFNTCSGLTSCTIGSGVTSIGENAFIGCSSLTSIDIPSGVTSIGNYTFYGCTSLESITVNATTPPTAGRSAFDRTNNCPIYVPSGSVNTYKSASGWSDYASRIQAIP